MLQKLYKISRSKRKNLGSDVKNAFLTRPYFSDPDIWLERRQNVPLVLNWDSSYWTNLQHSTKFNRTSVQTNFAPR